MSALADSALGLLIDIQDTLSAAPDLQSRLGDPVRVHDAAPATPAYPYLTYGDLRTEARDADGGAHRNTHRLTLHLWSRAGRMEVLRLLGRIQAVLERDLPHTVITLHADAFSAASGGRVRPDTRHGLLRLSIITETQI